MMTRPLLFTVFFLTWGMPTAPAQSLTDEPINGSLKGEPGNIQDHMFHSLYIDPRDENTVLVGTETNGIFKTTDGGKSWQRLRSGFRLNRWVKGYSQIFDISSSPHTPGLYFAAAINGPGPTEPEMYPSALAGVYISRDGGLSWFQKNRGLASTYVSYVLADPVDPKRLFAGVGGAKASFQMTKDVFFPGGIYRSDDEGENWTLLKTPEKFDTNILAGMVLRGSSPVRIFASGQLHRSDAQQAMGLITSSDGGVTWSTINPPGAVIAGFDVSKSRPEIIYGHDDSPQRRTHRSLDGGKTWEKMTGVNFFGEIRVHPTNPDILFFTGYNSIRVSQDGMKTAREAYVDKDLTQAQQMTDVEISDFNPMVVWACAKGYYLYKSSDGGRSFAKITAVRDLVYGK